MNLVEYPSDELLKERYHQIEQIAIDGINRDQLRGNPSVNAKYRGLDKWSIAAHGNVNDSSAGEFLETAKLSLEDLVKVKWVPASFRHITLTELLYHPVPRVVAEITTQDLMSYHEALLNNFPQNFSSVKLRLHRVFPTLDPEQPGVEGRTGALVGGFITDGDETIFQLKEELLEAVKKGGLIFNARLGGPPKVLFVTLGYFEEPPEPDEKKNHFLEVIGELNSSISECTTDIRNVTLIATSSIDYALPRGHIEIWPPIALNEKDQIQGSLRILRPSQRLWYHRLQIMLMGD